MSDSEEGTLLLTEDSFVSEQLEEAPIDFDCDDMESKTEEDETEESPENEESCQIMPKRGSIMGPPLQIGTDDDDEDNGDNGSSGNSSDSDASSTGTSSDCEGGAEEAIEDDESQALKKRLFDEKKRMLEASIANTNIKLEEIRAERSKEYIDGLADLEKQLQKRLEKADQIYECSLKNIAAKREADDMAAKRTMEDEMSSLFEEMKARLEKEKEALEHDRRQIDFEGYVWLTRRKLCKSRLQKSKRFCEFAQKAGRKRPYPIRQRLSDEEILEDWTAIRKIMLLHGPRPATTGKAPRNRTPEKEKPRSGK